MVDRICELECKLNDLICAPAPEDGDVDEEVIAWLHYYDFCAVAAKKILDPHEYLSYMEIVWTEAKGLNGSCDEWC